KLPQDQPNQIQLIALDIEKREINSWPIVYNPLASNGEHVAPGDFVPDNAGNNLRNQQLHLPDHFDRQTRTTPPTPSAPDLSAFYTEYRNKLSGQFISWDLRGVGVTQAGGAGKPVRGGLEEMYVPLRLGEGYSINNLEKGAVLTPADLMRCDTPLAIRGNAGAGKTTWMRWTFRRLLDDENAFPVMIELRRLVRDWSERPDQARNLETYMERWIADFVGE
ncbi:MAG: hypothetical protein GY859_37835, partial [Desulfobacterales bacterium]|nr:hypothetical protein [Desulfobacterales bacterium]